MEGDREDRGAAPEPGWGERIWAIVTALRQLFDTRIAIFQEELSEKGSLLGRALLGLGIAALFGVIAGLLVTALVVALLSKLLGSLALGLLAALVLASGVCLGAAYAAWRRLSQLRPFDFPATRREIDRDLDAVAEAAGIQPREAEAGDAPARGPDGGTARPETAEEIEARLRTGAG